MASNNVGNSPTASSQHIAPILNFYGCQTTIHHHTSSRSVRDNNDHPSPTPTAPPSPIARPSTPYPTSRTATPAPDEPMPDPNTLATPTRHQRRRVFRHFAPQLPHNERPLAPGQSEPNDEPANPEQDQPSDKPASKASTSGQAQPPTQQPFGFAAFLGSGNPGTPFKRSGIPPIPPPVITPQGRAPRPTSTTGDSLSSSSSEDDEGADEQINRLVGGGKRKRAEDEDGDDDAGGARRRRKTAAGGDVGGGLEGAKPAGVEDAEDEGDRVLSGGVEGGKGDEGEQAEGLGGDEAEKSEGGVVLEGGSGQEWPQVSWPRASRHTYSGIVVSDNSKAHFGDVYGGQDVFDDPPARPPPTGGLFGSAVGTPRPTPTSTTGSSLFGRPPHKYGPMRPSSPARSVFGGSTK